MRLVETVGPELPQLVVVVDATSVRLEGVDIETAAQRIARLR